MNKVILAIALLVVGCAGAPKTTISGADLYARANSLREQGHVAMPTSARTVITLRTDQYLVDRSRDQVFQVWEIVAGCHGNSLEQDPDCTVALMQEQRFVVSDNAPAPRKPISEEGSDISGLNKARLVLLAAGTAMAIGAAKCEAFDGCGEVLGIGAGLDALLLLVSFTGMH
jgi:hypothetical protein